MVCNLDYRKFSSDDIVTLVKFLNPEEKQESCAIAKMTTRCTLYMSALKVFETPYRPSVVTFPLS